MSVVNSDAFKVTRLLITELDQDDEDGACPTCGEDGGTSCGAPNCGLLSQEPDDGA